MALPGGAPLTSLQPPSLHPGHHTAQLSLMQVTCSAGTGTLLSLRKLKNTLNRPKTNIMLLLPPATVEEVSPEGSAEPGSSCRRCGSPSH